MKCFVVGLVLSAALLSGSFAPAVEYRVEAADAPAPEGVSAAVGAQLSAKGLKIMSGTSRTLCTVWLAKDWPVQEGFKPSSTVLYPFTMGQLVGVVEYKRKGGDFRGQDIPAGVYTMRYALQPVDGNHVGTSDTRDFLLLLKAEEDPDVQVVAKEKLFKQSAQAIGTAHPAMLCLHAGSAGDADLPKVENDEQREMATLRVSNPSSAGGKKTPLAIGLVVVGHAAE